MLDSEGRVVAQSERIVSKGFSDNLFSVSSISNGIYYLEINISGNKLIRKIAIQ
jgi:hypothetical protein